MSDPAAEKALNVLRKKESNKICADCDKSSKFGLGAVTVEYCSFVCHPCKSAHQSFSHHMKSVTMSNWKMSEVEKLKSSNGGGNKLCRRRWLAKITSKQLKQFKPKEGDDIKKFKKWIKMVYEDKRWYSSTPRPVGKKKTQPKKSSTKKQVASPTATQPRKPANVLEGLDFGVSSGPVSAPARVINSTGSSEFDFFDSPPVTNTSKKAQDGQDFFSSFSSSTLQNSKTTTTAGNTNTNFNNGKDSSSSFDFFASSSSSSTSMQRSKSLQSQASQQSTSSLDDFFGPSSTASTPVHTNTSTNMRNNYNNAQNAWTSPSSGTHSDSANNLSNDISSLFSSASTGRQIPAASPRVQNNFGSMNTMNKNMQYNNINSNTSQGGFDLFSSNGNSSAHGTYINRNNINDKRTNIATSRSRNSNINSSSNSGSFSKAGKEDPFANLGW